MKRLLFISFVVLVFSACCKEVCEDQGLMVRTQNMQAVDTDTVFLIRYEAFSRFSKKNDTVKRFTPVPVGSTLPSTFTDIVDYNYDWEIVIPALNKTYRIAYITTEKKPCHCEGGTYRDINSFELNSTRKEGSVAVLD